MPDVASLPCAANSTGCVYQPAWSGGRAATASVTTGGVRSSLIVTVTDDVPPPVALQPWGLPAVSRSSVMSWQPADGDPAGDRPVDEHRRPEPDVGPFTR